MMDLEKKYGKYTLKERLEAEKYLKYLNCLSWEDKMKIYIYYLGVASKIKAISTIKFKNNKIYFHYPFKDDRIVSFEEFCRNDVALVYYNKEILEYLKEGDEIYSVCIDFHTHTLMWNYFRYIPLDKSIKPKKDIYNCTVYI